MKRLLTTILITLSLTAGACDEIVEVEVDECESSGTCKPIQQ